MCFVSARDAESRQESLSPNRFEARRDRDIHSPQHQSASRNISSGLSITWGIGDNGFYVQQFATMRLCYSEAVMSVHHRLVLCQNGL